MSESEQTELFLLARDVVLASIPDVWAVYVYGSFARGEEWPHSDVDIALLMPPEKPIPDLLQLIGNLSERIGRDVDVIDLRHASDILIREVLEHGIAVHVSDPDRLLDWEATALSRYGRYRDEVRPILEQFHATGVGYQS